jgi:multicomponent Na+:H+ antiporter subunit D
MNNLVVLPIFIPLLTGILLIFLRRYPLLQRWIGIVGLIVALGFTGQLIRLIYTEGIQTLSVGGWPAPYGIPLVADMMSALLVFTTLIVAIEILLVGFDTENDRKHEKYFAYPLMLILVCGVNGSFLTGDMFNLFVFFEVMLISSYVLLTLGSQKMQLRQSIKYVLINLLSSTLFVVAIAYLYSAAGTLNMAHLSERVAEAGQGGLLTVISLLFLIVFGTKAALFLFFWLPGPYSAPPTVISALFAALLTKVGIYAIFRVFTLIFYHEPSITHQLMMVMGAFSMILGSFGAVAHWRIRKILAYNVIISVGFIVFGIGMASEMSLAGALYYLIHDMIAKAWIFILGGAIIGIAGTDRLRDIKGLIRYRPMLGWMFLLAVMAIAGVPPLSGFVGKAMILLSGVEEGYYLMTAIGLLTSLLALYSLLKVFIQSFWGEELLNEGEQHSSGKAALWPGAMLAALVIGLGLGAEWMLRLMEPAVKTMLNPDLYIKAVMGRE